jgi:Mce-associated membrane protein
MTVRTPRAAARRTAARPQTVRLVAPAAGSQPELDLDLGPEPGAEPALGKATPRWSLPPWRRDMVLVLVLLVALIGLGWVGLRWYDGNQLAAAHQAALAAAKQTTVDFVSISASSVDGDLQRIADGATGDFKDEFTRGMPQVRQAVVENKVESTGQVLRAGLVSGDLDSAVVLVAIDASVKNVGAPDGRLSHYRIQVDLATDPDSGRWLVSRLQFVG